LGGGGGYSAGQDARERLRGEVKPAEGNVIDKEKLKNQKKEKKVGKRESMG